MGLFSMFKKEKEPTKTVKIVPSAAPASFEIAGMFAHEQEIKELMGKNPYLEKPRKREGSRIFVLAPYDGPCELIPEPSNPHDPNAIKVVVKGYHIGYVPKIATNDVKTRLKAGQQASIKLLGGNYKMYEDGEWVTYKNDVKGTLRIE